jgi:hypothetical protein
MNSTTRVGIIGIGITAVYGIRSLRCGIIAMGIGIGIPVISVSIGIRITVIRRVEECGIPMPIPIAIIPHLRLLIPYTAVIPIPIMPTLVVLFMLSVNVRLRLNPRLNPRLIPIMAGTDVITDGEAITDIDGVIEDPTTDTGGKFGFYAK